MKADLVQFEVELMEAMNGERPAFPWGAAVGAALEALKGFGMVECVRGRYQLTAAGRAELSARRGAP